MQDSNTTWATRSFLHDANIWILPRPANSLDLDPIEHLCDQHKQCIRATQEDVHTHHQLIELLKRCPEDIPEKNIRNLVESMPRKLQECVLKRIEHTHY